jgi:hypothetical protein
MAELDDVFWDPASAFIDVTEREVIFAGDSLNTMF